MCKMQMKIGSVSLFRHMYIQTHVYMCKKQMKIGSVSLHDSDTCIFHYSKQFPVAFSITCRFKCGIQSCLQFELKTSICLFSIQKGGTDMKSYLIMSVTAKSP